jgi:hypothetical protein
MQRNESEDGMQEPPTDEVTLAQIAQAVPASTYSVRIALAALRITGRVPLENRRKVVYPADTIDTVREWLIETTGRREQGDT